MTSSMVDPISQSIIPLSAGLTQRNPQGGVNMCAKLTASSLKSKVCELGFISAGTVGDIMMLHLVRRRLRSRLHQATRVQQQVHPQSIESSSWGDRLVSWAANKLPKHVVQRLDQWPHKALVMVLVAFVSLGFVSWDVRLSGASRRRKQKPDKKKLVPLKDTEQDEPDAEPTGRNWWTTIPGNDFRRCTSDLSGTSTAQSSDPVVPVKALKPKYPVPSTDDEPEDEDGTGSHCWSAPGSNGFVAQQTAEVERTIQIFRMHTEGQVHLLDEEGLEQQKRESQVVPNGLVRSCTGGLEDKIQRKDHRRKTEGGARKVSHGD